MLSPECKKANADIKPVDPDEIICLEIPRISSSIDYLELLTPTPYKIILKFLDKVLPSENEGVFDIISRPDKIYHINLSYSLLNKTNNDDLITDICNNPISVEFYKIFDTIKTIKIGENQIHLLQSVYDNLDDFEGKLEFVLTVPLLNIKPVYFNYKIICRKDKFEFGVFDNFIKISVALNPLIVDYKIGFFYPVKDAFKKKIFLNDENNFEFVGFINEINRILFLDCSMHDQCIAIELQMEKNHYIGFLELNKLLAYETNFIQNILLYEFNWNAMGTKCSYKESIFGGHGSISVEKKPKSPGKKKKGKESIVHPPVAPATAPVVLVPVNDEENNQISIDVTVTLKYPLIIKELNPQLAYSQLFTQDEEEEEVESIDNQFNDIEALILSPDVNPQQMKDHIISIILPLLDKANVIDASVSKDRKANLIAFYFKLKELIADGYLKLVPLEIADPGRLEKNLLFMAKEFHAFGRLQQANQFYLMYLNENDFSENSFLQYISYNLKIQDFEKVRLCCQVLMNSNEANVIGLLIQSYMDFQMQNYLLCEKTLLNICKLSPGFIHAFVILFMLEIKAEKNSHLNWIASAISKWEKGQIYPGDEFETNYFEFCWTPPNSCDTFFKSAIFFINLGCFGFADICLSFNQLIQDNLQNDRMYVLSIIDFEQMNYKASLTHLKKYQLSHQTIYKFKFNLLYYLEDYGNFYDFFKKHVEDILWTLPPLETRQFYLKMAWYLISTNKFKEAKLYLDKIPEEFSTYMYWIAMGKCFIGMRQWREAERCFTNANNIDRLSREPWIYLSDIYEEMGQKPQADICRGNADIN